MNHNGKNKRCGSQLLAEPQVHPLNVSSFNGRVCGVPSKSQTTASPQEKHRALVRIWMQE